MTTPLPEYQSHWREPRDPVEAIMESQVRSAARQIGEDYPGVWESADAQISSLRTLLAPIGERIGRSKIPKSVLGQRVVVWSLFVLSLMFFGFSLGAYGSSHAGTYRGPSDAETSSANTVVTLWLFFSALWWIFLLLLFRSRRRNRQILDERSAWLTEIGTETAFMLIGARKEIARNYTPGSLRTGETLPSSMSAPAPQPFGVSDQGAEELCAAWMRYLGERDAAATQFTGDGGIDVSSMHYIAQVKNYAGSVGVAAVRELAGVAHLDGRKALFFTSGSYPRGAVDFATATHIALFHYSAAQGVLLPANPLAEDILTNGL